MPALPEFNQAVDESVARLNECAIEASPSRAADVADWETLATAEAPDGEPLELRRRGDEYRIRAGGLELMSTEDEPSSRSLAEFGCAYLTRGPKLRVLVGGLGMGFTLRAALDLVGSGRVEVAELVPAVVAWNEGPLGPLAGHPLRDPRCDLFVGDVRVRIRAAKDLYDAILLDVDNGPIALAHAGNNALYGVRRCRPRKRSG